MNELDLHPPEEFLEYEEANERRSSLFFIFALPAMILLFAVFGILETAFLKDSSTFFTKNTFASQKHSHFNGANILSANDISRELKDTVYTKKDCWLELRIDQQMLYQHWRDGSVTKFPISSGNKHLDSKALESRPGLFAIFFKNAHHESSQFDNADMYHFMPFNQGIGFHSINGTGYYQHLGKQPSSHGCIRMSHADAEKLFKSCELGTLVLAHRGQTARTVGFAPKDFENPREYSETEYKALLAKNLYNLLHGRYFIEEKEQFVVDPKVIPVSGVYISYDKKVPERQILPRDFVIHYAEPDNSVAVKNEIVNYDEAELIALVGSSSGNGSDKEKDIPASDADLIKKYFSNPIGVLPYFPPSKPRVTYVYTYRNTAPSTTTTGHTNGTNSRLNSGNAESNTNSNSGN